MDRDYGHTSYGRSMDSFAVDNSSDRYGPYESFDSRSAVSGRDLYRSGYGYNESNQGYGDSYDGRYENPYRSSVDSYDGRNQGGSSWDPSFTRTKVRTGFMEDRGRDTYSSYGAFSSPYMKPATVGSRGRGMPAYPDGAFGGRSNDAFGGPAAGRGRGRGGQLGRGVRRSGMFDHKKQPMAGGMARGIKRKMGQPFKSPVPFGKKQKVNKAGGNQKAKNTPAPEPVDPEEEEKRRTEARREKQRRRREKNSEKYGDGSSGTDRMRSSLRPQGASAPQKVLPSRRDSGPRFQTFRRSRPPGSGRPGLQTRLCARMAFTCSFCKFRSFDEKGIEEHLENQAHQDMLDHIQKQTKFDKPVMEFLHECIVNKYKKTAARKAQSVQNEAAKAPEKDIMEGVTPDDHMIKVETVHCSACSVYVPALHSSVQLHLKSADHSKSKLGYKDQIKRESILTATSILNNPLVKARYELYLKGENPFEAHPEETAVGSVAEDATEVPPAAGSSDAEGAPASEDFTADCLASSEGN